MEITTTLYYIDDFPEPGEKHTFCDDHLLGRALNREECDTITAQELRDAIDHSIFRDEVDLGELSEQDFNALSADQLKAALQKNDALIIRSDVPLFRNVFPPITRGPRKGEPNRRKDPEVFEDRLYRIDWIAAGVVAVEDQRIELTDDGSFKILTPELIG
jgi:hypothetical protein